MSRVALISLVGLAAAVAANAGSIEIGGSSGLTSNYIQQGAGAVCAAGAGNCVTGSTTGWVEKNFDNVLFAGATNGSTTPTPFAGYQQTGGTPSGLTATDTTHNVTFAMLSDGANVSNQSNNYWNSATTGGVTNPTSITVPIGIYGATDVWTMLDNEWGIVGGQDTTVTFNFGSTSNATSGLTSVVVNLTNSNNAGGGELRSAVSCTGGTLTICNSTTDPQGTFTQGQVINGVTVNEGLVYNTFLYNTVPSSQAFYYQTTGKVKLDDQQFVFGSTYLNDWLVSMTVTENVPNNYVSNPSAPSETALTAITVDTAAPEPTTVLLLLSGLGGLGYLKLRRS